MAILGAINDPAGADRWLRRGCRAHLRDDISLADLVDVLVFALRHDLIVAANRTFATSDWQGPLPVSLTGRQREILHHVRDGLHNSEIARLLSITETTVEYHITNLLNKLAVRNRTELVQRSNELGL